MPRKTIIFGNGLGMALDPEHFSLPNALRRVWEDEDILSDDQRELIQICLPHTDADRRPSGEDDLDLLQQVLAACDFLGSVEIGGDVGWLSERGREFPSAIRSFVHSVACQFHIHDYRLPAEFVDTLAMFLNDSRSHIATLNYDNLLYQPLIEREILRGYSGALIDGITNAGFSEDNMYRYNRLRLGWYLHLHGSPLFYDDDDGRVHKHRQIVLDLIAGADFSHIVLTHVKHKPSVIAASNILSSYWIYLDEAMGESSEIVFVGYSGCDTHLNRRVAAQSHGKDIHIIEWTGTGNRRERFEFWISKFKKVQNLHVTRCENILDFRNW